MKYEQLKALKKELIQVGKQNGVKVFHFFNPAPKGNYIVWSEDDTARAFADGVAGQKAVQGTTDYFTKTEYDPVVDAIDAAMNGIDRIYLDDGPMINYENASGYIHYTWIWEVV